MVICSRLTSTQSDINTDVHTIKAYCYTMSDYYKNVTLDVLCVVAVMCSVTVSPSELLACRHITPYSSLFSYVQYMMLLKNRTLSLLLPRLPKIHCQCYVNGHGNLSNLGCNNEIQYSLSKSEQITVISDNKGALIWDYANGRVLS